jgi:hypothetical protein
MQSLTFTNSNGENTLISMARPFLLNSIEGTEAVRKIGDSFEKRYINIVVHIHANQNESIFDLRRHLTKIFNPDLGEGVLHYEYDGKVLEIKAKADTPPIFPSGSENRLQKYQKALITLVSENPIWTSEEFNISTFNTPVTPLFQFPLESLKNSIEFGYENKFYSVLNDGDLPSPFYLEVSGEIEIALIFNKSNNGLIKITKGLNVGEKLVIDTGVYGQEVTLVKTDGSMQNGFEYLSPESSLWKLDTGINEIEYTVKNNSRFSSIKLKWKTQYLGI